MENKILIIDDERTVIQHVSALLNSFGYQSFFIPRAQFLFKKLETEEIDLILMDINMPEIDGITLLKQLKENQKYNQIPVIMMTGDTSQQTLETCFQLGADDYVTKPVQELILKSRVKSVIEKQIYLKQIHQKNSILEEQMFEIQRQKSIVDDKNKKITQSIIYAKTIQEALLPNFEQFKQIFRESFLIFKPKDIVSGDFYWFSIKDNFIYLAAVDCTGHGVPGAFMSILGESFLDQIINLNNITQTDLILNNLDNNVKQTFLRNQKERLDGMDICLCKINLQTFELEYSGAHNSLLIIRNNDLIELKADRMAIGGKFNDINKEFSVKTCNLQKQDSVYLFSDGYSDQFSKDTNRKFTTNRFKNKLLEINNQPMNIQFDFLTNTLENWQKDTIQIDDIMVIGFKIL